jgi:TetR/AcrR family transcriptional repressor of nem operon
MRTVADTRERLLNSALDLIHARSYAKVGVQELCDHAGVNKGSFYHFFPSKRDLTVAALERQWQIAKQTVWDPAFASNLPVIQKLECCLDHFYQHQCHVKDRTGQVPGCPFGNLALELSTQDEVIRRKVDQIFGECEKYVERILEDAIAAGEIPKLDTQTTAAAVIAYMEGVMLMAKTRNDPHVIKELHQGLTRFLQAMPFVTGKTRSDKKSKEHV